MLRISIDGRDKSHFFDDAQVCEQEKKTNDLFTGMLRFVKNIRCILVEIIQNMQVFFLSFICIILYLLVQTKKRFF